MENGDKKNEQLYMGSTPIPGFMRVLWSVWLCFGLESRGTPLPLGFWRVRYCLVVGEECSLWDCGWFLSVFDVGADVRCGTNAKCARQLSANRFFFRCKRNWILRLGTFYGWGRCTRALRLCSVTRTQIFCQCPQYGPPPSRLQT